MRRGRGWFAVTGLGVAGVIAGTNAAVTNTGRYYRPELRRTLGFGALLVYGLIYMVPIAPIGIFGSVYASSGGMPAMAYLVGMIALAFTAASYAQMVRAFPLAGSV